MGLKVQSGGAGFQRCPSAEGSPITAAMVSFEQGPNRSRYSWDPVTTLVAARGISGVPSVTGCVACDGSNVIDPVSGTNEWMPGGPTNQTYLVLTDAAAAGEAIDALLCVPPQLVVR